MAPMFALALTMPACFDASEPSPDESSETAEADETDTGSETGPETGECCVCCAEGPAYCIPWENPAPESCEVEFAEITGCDTAFGEVCELPPQF